MLVFELCVPGQKTIEVQRLRIFKEFLGRRCELIFIQYFSFIFLKFKLIYVNSSLLGFFVYHFAVGVDGLEITCSAFRTRYWKISKIIRFYFLNFYFFTIWEKQEGRIRKNSNINFSCLTFFYIFHFKSKSLLAVILMLCLEIGKVVMIRAKIIF